MEKALCDKLYKVRPAINLSEFEELLFDDMRLEEDLLFNLNKETIKEYSELYRCRNVSLLDRYLCSEEASQ